jgi:hypothetical protein
MRPSLVLGGALLLTGGTLSSSWLIANALGITFAAPLAQPIASYAAALDAFARAGAPVIKAVIGALNIEDEWGFVRYNPYWAHGFVALLAWSVPTILTDELFPRDKVGRPTLKRWRFRLALLLPPLILQFVDPYALASLAAIAGVGLMELTFAVYGLAVPSRTEEKTTEAWRQIMWGVLPLLALAVVWVYGAP